MSEESSKTPAVKLLLPAIIILAAALRLFHLGAESLWFDELYAIWADRLPIGGLVREHLASGHPPLFYLLLRGWLWLGTGETWVRLLSAVAGVASVWFVYLAGKELFSRRAGLWGAALAAVSPLLIWYSQAATFYSFMIALTTLSFLLLVRSTLRGGWLNWAGYTAATLAVFFTYFFGGVLLAAGAAFFLVLRGRQSVRNMPWLTSMGVLAAGVAVSYLASRQAISEPSTQLQPPGLAELARLAYGAALAPFVLVASPIDNALNYTGLEGAPWGHLLALSLLLAGLVVVAAVSRPARSWLLRNETLGVCAFILIVVVLPVALQTANGGSLSGRFYSWAAPIAMLIAGAAIAALSGRLRVVCGSVLLAGLLSLTLLTYYDGPARDADWRGIMARISDGRQKDDRMFCFPLHSCTIAASYYLTDGMPIIGGMPAGNNGTYLLPPGADWTGYRSGYWAGTGATPALSGQALDARFDQELAGASRVWLVAGPDIFETEPAVGRALSGWQKVAAWDYGYSELQLYERPVR